VPSRETGGAPGFKDALVIVGRVRKPQGLHGEVLVEPITDAPDAVFAPGARVHLGTTSGDPSSGGADLTVTRGRPFKESWIVRFEGIEHRDAIEGWRGRYLLAAPGDLADLAADEIYRHELLGLRVIDRTAGEIGVVAELYELPQGLTLEVSRSKGTALVPYRAEIVTEVDLDEGIIRIDAPAGLLD
jgi:16S rRNA processing protein RimM